MRGLRTVALSCTQRESVRTREFGESTPPLGLLSVRVLCSDWLAGDRFVCYSLRTPMTDVCGGAWRGREGRGFPSLFCHADDPVGGRGEEEV